MPSRRRTGADEGSAATTRASRRCMDGESGLADSLTALTKTRRPSAKRIRAARPGENPPGWVTASATPAPTVRSMPSRTCSGSWSQRTRTPRAGGLDPCLEKDTSAQSQVVIYPFLDRVPDLVRQRHDQALVVRRFGRMLLDMEGRVEVDAPLAGQWDQSERPQPRPERRDREVRKSKELRDRRQVGHHRIDLLRTDDGDRDDRRARADRCRDEATSPKSAQSIPILEVLASPADPFREHEDELVALEQSPSVVRMSDGLAGPAQEPAQDGHPQEHARNEGADMPRMRMLGKDRSLDHRPIPRQHARVVGDEERATTGRHVLDAGRFNTPVVAVQDHEG